jgi:hypothetical protein
LQLITSKIDLQSDRFIGTNLIDVLKKLGLPEEHGKIFLESKLASFPTNQ